MWAGAPTTWWLSAIPLLVNLVFIVTPVVIVSMAASPADGPRGMEFLLSPNRLNLAVSRGQWCAVVVRSPALTDYLPATPEALQVLGRFTRLCRRGRPAGLP